jgi:adenosylmethionine-8-amino-7-oxononanoate aminotransferase
MKCDDHFLFPRDLSRDYPIAVRGEGVWVFDENGNKYLDGCAGANVTAIGHGVAEVAEEMAKQAKNLAYPPPQHFLNRPSLELCELLVKMAPRGYTRVMLCSGGSEAMDNAFKIARQYHVYSGRSSKYRLVSRWRGFNGNTLAADAVGGHTSRRSISMPMLMPVPHIVAANCYRCPFALDPADCDTECALDLETLVVQEDPDYIAAFVAETVVGAAAAALTPGPDYYRQIRRICDDHDILWIADEIMCGAGRTGSFLAAEQWDALPDIAVLAKGLSSGYAPLSAILLKEKVFEAFRSTGSPYIGGHTYNAHPVTAAVGTTVLNYMQKHDLISGVQGKAGLLFEGLEALSREFSIVGDVRGKGLMAGLEFVQNRDTKEPFPPGSFVAKRVSETAMNKGLIVYPVSGCADGKKGDGLLLSPPLTITAGEIDVLLKLLRETLADLSRELKGDRM